MKIDATFIGNDKDMTGKTVAKAVLNMDQLLIRFTDGSYTALMAYGGSCDEDAELYFEMPDRPYKFYQIGMITADQYQQENIRADEERKLARKKKYEELKKEFEQQEQS